MHADLVVAHGVAGVATHLSEIEVHGDEFNVAAGTEDAFELRYEVREG